MPKIFLKPNSPDFAEAQTDSPLAACDMPGCSQTGEKKAPKHRGLNEYFWFCEDHIKEYNKAWNFFEGMADTEVQDHVRKSMYGDRPTWKAGVNGAGKDDLRKEAWKTYTGKEDAPSDKERRKRSWQTMAENRNTPEFEAMAIMGLEPPVTLEEIKTRYKKLAKKHHPDLNRGCKKSEDILKGINMSYTILKLSFEKFEKLEER